MKQHIDNILLWAADRGLLQNDPRVQCLKGVSELGELADNIAKGRYHHAKDDIGDIVVVLTILSAQVGGTLFVPEVTDAEPIHREPVSWVLGLTNTFGDMATLVDHGTTSTDRLDLLDQIAVAMYILDDVCKSIGTTLDECTQIAYDEIKDRKGKTVGGVFIKESDVG